MIHPWSKWNCAPHILDIVKWYQFSIQLIWWLYCMLTYACKSTCIQLYYSWIGVIYLQLYNKKLFLPRTFKMTVHKFAMLREEKKVKRIKKFRSFMTFLMSAFNVNVLTDFWRFDSWHLNISYSHSVNMKTRWWVAVS